MVDKDIDQAIQKLYEQMCSDCENAHRCHNRCENCDEFEEELQIILGEQ